MSASITPVVRRPPWRVRLEGRPADLEHLAEVAEGLITKADGEYWLQSKELNDIRTIGEVPNQAEKILSRMNALALISKSGVQPVKGTAVQGTDERGKWARINQAYVTVTLKVHSALEVPLKLEEALLRIAESDNAVRAVVQDLSGEHDFATARRIGETVLLDLGVGDSLRGVDEIVNRGWATRAECERFKSSVNHGDGNKFGSHSPLKRSPINGAMSCSEAWDFLRVLLGNWLDSK